MGREEEILEARQSLTIDMNVFIWLYVIRPLLLDQVSLNILDDVNKHIILTTFDVDGIDPNIPTDYDIISFAVCLFIPDIYKCDYMLIFSKKRVATEQLKRDLAAIKQQTPLWYLFKSMFSGCSTMAPIMDLQPFYFRPRKNIHTLWAEYMGISPKIPFTEEALARMRHGNIYEDFACDIYSEITGNAVTHLGMKVWDDCTFYANSPDGIIEKDVYTGEKGIIEIKCPSSKGECHDYVPEEYQPQCISGSKFHGAKFCDFISLYFVPESTNPPQMMIQRVFFTPEYWNWLERGLLYFEECCVERKPPEDLTAMEISRYVPDLKTHILLEKSYINFDNGITFHKCGA
jgi:hypothetical protein